MEEYESMRYVDLLQLCRERKLKRRGRKRELIEYLRSNDAKCLNASVRKILRKIYPYLYVCGTIIRIRTSE
jgi:hypothetical protein